MLGVSFCSLCGVLLMCVVAVLTARNEFGSRIGSTGSLGRHDFDDCNRGDAQA